MTVKLEKVRIYNNGSPSIKSFGALSAWSSDHVTDKKHYISTFATPMTNKLDRVVGSHAGLLCTKSHNLLITWSHKAIYQMQNVINSFSRDLWLSDLTEWWLTIRSHMSNNKVTYPSDHAVTSGHVTNELLYIFVLRSLLPLNLTRWWLVN